MLSLVKVFCYKQSDFAWSQILAHNIIEKNGVLLLKTLSRKNYKLSMLYIVDHQDYFIIRAQGFWYSQNSNVSYY